MFPTVNIQPLVTFEQQLIPIPKIIDIIQLISGIIT